MIALGEIILVSSGEYSSYGIIALTTALKTFDEDDARKQYLKEKHGGPLPKYEGSESDFGDWLIEKGFLSPIKYREFYLGDYGDFAAEGGSVSIRSS